MAQSELTADPDDIEQWAQEHGVVPVREDDRITLVPEDDVGPGQDRLDWAAFHREVDQAGQVVIRHGEASGSDAFEVTDREDALDRVTTGEELDRDEVESRLIDGETITGTITETTVIERTIVEEATLESEVVDSDIVGRSVVDVTLLDRTCESCDIVEDTASADPDRWYADERFLGDETGVATGEGERYDEYPFDFTVEVVENWSATIEEFHRYTVETRITDVDVSETDTVGTHDLEAEVDIEAVHEQLLTSDLVDVDVKEGDVVDTDTYRIEGGFTEDDTITTYLTAQRTFDREVSERRRFTTAVVGGELLAQDVVSEELRESTLAEREREIPGADEDLEEDVRLVPEKRDVGKPVVVPTGDQIGMVTGVEDDIAYVDAHPGITERIMATLGWGGIDEEDFPLEPERIQRITEDEVVVSGEYEEEDLESIEVPE